MRKRFFLILAVCLVPTILHAESSGCQARGRVKGVVTDSASRIMPKVRIIIENEKAKTKFEVLSDGAGKFEVELPANSYNISAEKEGYRSPEPKALRVTPNADVTFDIVFPPIYTNDDPNPNGS